MENGQETSWLTGATAHVVDDDAAARQSCALLLRSMGLQTDSHASAEEFFRATSSGEGNERGVLILDLRLGGINGIELMKRLSVRRKALFPVLLVSGYADVPTAVNAFELGVFTLIEKPYSEQTLWDSVVRALQHSQRSAELYALFEDEKRRLATLSEAEHAVVKLVLEGASNAEIAARLDISIRTLQERKKDVLEKVGTESIPELIWMLAQHANAEVAPEQ